MVFLQKGFCLFVNYLQIASLLLCRKYTTAIALAVNIILFTHLNRTLIAGILFEITRQVMRIVDFLDIHADLINQLTIFFGEIVNALPK